MNTNIKWFRVSQLMAVLFCAGALKLYYSTASVNGLRWILCPTAWLVELSTGTTFTFESYAGYLSSDNTFLIAASCSGVNFMIAAFLMLTLRKLWQDGHGTGWLFIPVSAVIAYLTTIIANTVRISTSLYVRELDPEVVWLNPDQLHRLEGVFIYFGFLLLLFLLSERSDPRKMRYSNGVTMILKLSMLPLVIYYGTTLGIPLANGALSQGAAFLEHSIVVLVTPIAMILLAAIGQAIKYHITPHPKRHFSRQASSHSYI